MTDYISREAANKEIIRFIGYLDEDMIYRLRLALNRLPAADVKPVVKGEWSRVIALHGEKYWCSECKGVTGKRSNFCPNCGADMRPREKLKAGAEYADADTMIPAT